MNARNQSLFSPVEVYNNSEPKDVVKDIFEVSRRLEAIKHVSNSDKELLNLAKEERRGKSKQCGRRAQQEKL